MVRVGVEVRVGFRARVRAGVRVRHLEALGAIALLH